MKITDFERNAEDMVVAICGEIKHILSWDFVNEHKPQIGDFLAPIDGVVAFAKEEADKAEEVIAEVLPAEPVATAEPAPAPAPAAEPVPEPTPAPVTP